MDGIRGRQVAYPGSGSLGRFGFPFWLSEPVSGGLVRSPLTRKVIACLSAMQVRLWQARATKCWSQRFRAPVAQWTERLPSKQLVAGSNPAGGAVKVQVMGTFVFQALTARTPD